MILSYLVDLRLNEAILGYRSCAVVCLSHVTMLYALAMDILLWLRPQDLDKLVHSPNDKKLH